MNVFLSVFIIIICVLLILIVLVQNSKGGGLASNFASSNQYMGVRKTADFLEKATWTLAGALLFLCLLSSITIKSKEAGPKSAIEQDVRTQGQTQIPQFPVNAPANKSAATPAPAQSNKNSTSQPVKK
ncbi:MAG TPA: preprotein translocase subunit SecG [Bacteroidales bacterium]